MPPSAAAGKQFPILNSLLVNRMKKRSGQQAPNDYLAHHFFKKPYIALDSEQKRKIEECTEQGILRHSTAD